MTDQLPMFLINPDALQQPKPGKPICRVCRIRPLATRRDGEHHPYCGVKGCASRERLCHTCDQRYHLDTPGAGKKYCSTECKTKGYSAGFTKRDLQPCAICQEPAYTFTRTPVCQQCKRQHAWANSLRTHHAPQWAWDHMRTDGTCMNPSCGTRIDGYDKRQGKRFASVNLDHDHTCCPGEQSCGQCVRGLLCNPCNQALGLLRNNEAIISGLGIYLAMTKAAP